MPRRNRPTIGGYTLERHLGQGGQGSVWQASRDGTLVALKIIDTGYDDELAAGLTIRLRREMEALRLVSHPSVIRVVGAGESEDGGRLYAAYELVNGQNVYAALRAPSPPSPDDCSAFVISLSAGLDAVHDLGIVHRDIKPGNIALRADNWGTPVLLDFGLLRRPSDGEAHTNPTATGVAVGTYGYIAPEVIADPRCFSRRSDQWSLARVVLEVLMVSMRYDVTEFSTHGEMVDWLADSAEAPHALQVLRRAFGPADARYESLAAFAGAFQGALVSDGLIAAPAPATPRTAATPLGSTRRPDEPLREYLTRLGCAILADLRSQGGALWFTAPDEITPDLQRLLSPVPVAFARGGGRATGHVPAWWTKDAG